MAVRLGFKARILRWPDHLERDFELARLARERGEQFRSAVAEMLRRSKAFSPFIPPEQEHRRFNERLDLEKGKDFIGLRCGFAKLDRALGGIRGLNILGGPPKAGKSCFFMQVSTEMARRGIPVIYYDFENGRQKIYGRTLCRMALLSDAEIRADGLDADRQRRLKAAQGELQSILRHFRVVTDRQLSPDIMRRQIDFLQHETRANEAVVVVDSLHKLPFESLSDRRTGIDAWLRHMEAIRDEQQVAFFVISELSRDKNGGYSKKPDLGAFKESGDIEYSADNAMILIPDWDLLDPISTAERKSSLWLVASRENSPGRIATYRLDYPYWGFREL
jgi:replicative DNA helicase